MKEKYMNELEKFGDRVANFSWESPASYANWCAQTYWLVCHSTRLLSLAASRFYKDEDKYHQRFLAHIQEEKLHENLAKKDVEKLGFSLENFPMLSVTKGFVESQYYQIDRLYPSSFLGYVLFLEGIAAHFGQEIYDRVKGSHGQKAESFVRLHAQEDVGHVEKALDMILKTEDPKEAQVIFENFKTSGELYCKMLDDIEAKTASDVRAA